MKIGIITFHRAISYGAVLQAFALKRFLSDNGFEAEIIDYRNEFFEKMYYSTEINLSKYEQFKNSFSIKKRVKRILEIPYLHMLGKKFLEFQEIFLGIDIQSKGITQLSDSATYDYYIAGSDQVWNPRLTNNDMTYFLNFADSCKKISFSASIGGYPIEGDDGMIHSLKSFKAISVREMSTKDKLFELGIENICVNLDPVFLLSEQDWKELASCKEKIGYVLLFEVGRNKQLLKYALDYSKAKHKKLYYLSTDFVRFMHTKICNLYTESPRDFLTWIKNADYVFTNSFHGTAFSIIFKKKFYCHIIKKQKSSDRMITLLNSFGMDEFSEADKIGLVNAYDLSDVISENREKTLQYLRRNTEGAMS